LEKKTAWRTAGLVFFILALIAAAFYYYNFFVKVEPGPLLEETMNKAHLAKSYTYRMTAELKIGGTTRPWIEVEGERASESYHFRGKTLGTPVEIYQIGSRSYTRDPVTGQWTVLDGVDLAQQQLYMAEIDPLSNFRFQTKEVPHLLGAEQVNGHNCWVMEVKPQVENKYLELWWDDFTYRFWVDKKSRLLVRAHANARSKSSSDTTLNMVVDFKDFNKKIKIEPPI
jgi:hypothetical protein